MPRWTMPAGGAYSRDMVRHGIPRHDHRAVPVLVPIWRLPYDTPIRCRSIRSGPLGGSEKHGTFPALTEVAPDAEAIRWKRRRRPSSSGEKAAVDRSAAADRCHCRTPWQELLTSLATLASIIPVATSISGQGSDRREPIRTCGGRGRFERRRRTKPGKLMAAADLVRLHGLPRRLGHHHVPVGGARGRSRQDGSCISTAIRW